MRREPGAKSIRALELYEKGIAPSVIAERLGLTTGHVNGALQRARQRRERERQKPVEVTE